MFNHKKDKNQDKSEGVKSDFITVASHQLRTPMSAVRWSLDTLLSGRTGKLSEKQKEVVKEAYRNNSFMVKVVNDLLKISRVEEKGLNLVPERVDIIKIINEVIKENKDFAKAFNCKIILKKPTKFSKAYIDPLQIKPVIRALIDNAIRYSKIKTDNNIQISLNKLGKFLLLKIKDQGIGIPEKQKQLIFSKFFRGNNAIKIQTEGIGLDLYLAKIVIESSGGKIDFKSTENKGTIFNIYLPTTEKQFLSVKKEQEEEEPEDILKKEREFVSITVHELKAPLGVTKWSLEMLKSKKPGSLTSDQIELIDQIYRGNERLLTLVRDLLNLSKLQEGKFEIESRSIKFEEVVDDVIKGFLVQAKTKDIKINWEMPKNLPKVKADPSRVAQVATNLISNAIKYTKDKGKIDISITKNSGKKLKLISRTTRTADIKYFDNKKGYLVFAVKDSGIGISAKDKKKLFSKFFRSEKVLKEKTEGTGLGLYITKSIVNLHKGDIWFESRLGKGSTFYFSLPIA